MGFLPTNIIEQSSNKMKNVNIKPKKLYQCNSEKNGTCNEKSNLDKETLNLLKGIVKITSVKNNSKNNIPIIKSNSENNKNIFGFTNYLFNNEEHLNKNLIHTLKNKGNNPSQNSSLSQIKSFTKNFSTDKKSDKSQSSKTLINFSKERGVHAIKKSLFKKNSYNFSGFNLRRKSKSGIKNKFGESSNNNRRFSKNFSFFLKLKEKEKNPSKTPYLDKKSWKNEYNFNNLNETNKNIHNNENNSIASSIGQNHSQKILNYNIKKNNKKLMNDENKENKTINNNKEDLGGKIETNKFEYNNKENKDHSQNKKGRKNHGNIIINILNKPFFCCFKS